MKWWVTHANVSTIQNDQNKTKSLLQNNTKSWNTYSLVKYCKGFFSFRPTCFDTAYFIHGFTLLSTNGGNSLSQECSFFPVDEWTLFVMALAIMVGDMPLSNKTLSVLNCSAVRSFIFRVVESSTLGIKKLWSRLLDWWRCHDPAFSSRKNI